MKDAAAAYQLALRWKLSDDDTYAKAGIDILNAWANKCTGYIVNSKGEFIDPNQYLIAIQIYQLANAAEILRDYEDGARLISLPIKTGWWMFSIRKLLIF